MSGRRQLVPSRRYWKEVRNPRSAARVLVSARKLAALGVVDAELPGPAPISDTARPLSAPELVADDRERELLP